MYRQRRRPANLLLSAVLLAVLFLGPLLTSGPSMPSRALPEPPEEPETVEEPVEIEPEPVPEPEPEPEPEPPAMPEAARDNATVLRVLNNGDVMTMDFGTYLAGVLRGEMPASFEEEALKAQAVAARTYTRRMLVNGGKHGSRADICTNPGCCQAYKSEASARKGWGRFADEYEAKIEAAVRDTDGETLLYDGAPILALFHSSSPGLTQEVGHVWGGGDTPYLVPVSSPEQAENVPNYYSRAEFEIDTVRRKILASFPEADLSGAPENWLTDDVRNSAGTVLTVNAGGVSVRGEKMRSMFSLRSACFNWEIEDGKFVFYVTAFGHGVGLSQYGANQMARDGADYRKILTHYYTGVTIGPYLRPEE